jgi:hypothetical protein
VLSPVSFHRPCQISFCYAPKSATRQSIAPNNEATTTTTATTATTATTTNQYTSLQPSNDQQPSARTMLEM